MAILALMALAICSAAPKLVEVIMSPPALMKRSARVPGAIEVTASAARSSEMTTPVKPRSPRNMSVTIVDENAAIWLLSMRL